MSIKAQTIDNQLTEIADESVNQLHMQIGGQLITPADSNYDEERKVWNAMIDRRPAIIIQCSSTADIVNAVQFAKKHRLLISVRGAGHNIAGRAIQDHVLLIDLSKMRKVSIDQDAKIATVSPGATLSDIDEETAKYGLALPVGINSTTGISGLTLGGGFGWLSRTHGMTVDHLISAELVTVNGERLICDKQNRPDLFWAIRGGGGNFAIVSSFKFDLVPMSKKVLCGPVIFDMANAKETLLNFRNFLKNAPEKLTVWSVLRHSPPFPFLDRKHHGKPILALVGFYNGPMDEGEKYFSQLNQLGNPLGSGVSPHLFTDFQKAFDSLLSPGKRNYWKTHNFKEMNGQLIDIVVKYGMNLPSGESEIFFAQMGGATNKVSPDATAYPHRDVEFIMNVHTRWEDSEQDHQCITWSRDFFKDTQPFATGGAYSNFVSEGDDSIESAYGKNADKLKKIKSEYDPNNVLRTNLNVNPSI